MLPNLAGRPSQYSQIHFFGAFADVPPGLSWSRNLTPKPQTSHIQPIITSPSHCHYLISYITLCPVPYRFHFNPFRRVHLTYPESVPLGHAPSKKRQFQRLMLLFQVLCTTLSHRHSRTINNCNLKRSDDLGVGQFPYPKNRLYFHAQIIVPSLSSRSSLETTHTLRLQSRSWPPPHFTQNLRLRFDI
jgi:hypothetical protein